MFYHLKIVIIEQVANDIFSNCRNKRLQCYDRWAKVFWPAIYKNDLRTNGMIWKIAAGQGYVYTAGCLVDYPISKNITRW